MAFEVNEEVDLDCEDDDGNPCALVTLGMIEDGSELPHFIEGFEAICAKVPDVFKAETYVSTSSYRGLELRYQRALTPQESAEVAAANSSHASVQREQRFKRYLELKSEFEPDPSGLAHEPLNLSEAA